MKYLDQGIPVSPAELLDRRETRANTLEELQRDFPNHTLLSMKMNIPGPIKDNDLIRLAFRLSLNEILLLIKDSVVMDQTQAATGPEVIIKTSRPAHEIKLLMIELEESLPLGRLLDIDVLTEGSALSREAMGLNPRRCFLCDKPARECSRSAAHPLTALLEAIETLMLQDPSIQQQLPAD